jgi:hypothetical protein
VSLLRRCLDVRLDGLCVSCCGSGWRAAAVEQKMRRNLLVVGHIMSEVWLLTELLMHDHLRGCRVNRFQHVLWRQMQE